MRYRNLRISWSVFWGVVCVLLVVLWVRSNWRAENVWVRTPGFGPVALSSVKCRVLVSHIDAVQLTSVWSAHSYTIEDAMGGAGDELPKWPGFGFVNFGKGSFQLTIPHWFLVLLSAALAAVLWLPYRFGLRTLLIATTLIAVVLGLVVWAARQ